KDGGSGVEGGFLFTTASPCELCAKKAYQLGMTKIFYIDPYPGISFDHILTSGLKHKQPEMVLFNGAIGRAFHNLYTPIAAYKDELNALMAH
ncbi:dCMP deaminase, partial [Vibrio parahaemolyticus]